MKCEHIHDKLSEYLEGLLDHENDAAVQNHLSSCSHCQDEVKALERSIRAVANLPSVEPPPGFSRKVMARIREEAERPRLWQRLFLPMPVKIPIHAMGLLLVAGLAVYLYQANRPTVSMEQKKMPESVPFKSEPIPQRKPQSAAGERQKETDAITPSASGDVGGLKRDENVPQELAKRKMSDLKSAKVAASIMADYELALTPQKPFEEMEKLSPKLEGLVKKSEGEYLQPEQRTDGLKQNTRQSQIVWLLIPENRYSSFISDLSTLGKIETETIPGSSSSTPLSSAETSSMLRIKLTIRSTEKP